MQTLGPPLDLEYWLEDNLPLTPIETRIMRALAACFGQWMPTETLALLVYQELEPMAPGVLEADTRSLRTHIYRIRPKLRGRWRIENRYWHACYRLVAV